MGRAGAGWVPYRGCFIWERVEGDLRTAWAQAWSVQGLGFYSGLEIDSLMMNWNVGCERGVKDDPKISNLRTGKEGIGI